MFRFCKKNNKCLRNEFASSIVINDQPLYGEIFYKVFDDKEN